MRTLLLLLASLTVLSLAPLARAQDAPTFSQSPVTEQYLQQLDEEQLRTLRSVLQGCAKPGGLRASSDDPCVTSRTDEAILSAGNPDLEAFHRALPPSARYDETRSSTAWRSWLNKN
jgi:hypothetical protein